MEFFLWHLALDNLSPNFDCHVYSAKKKITITKVAKFAFLTFEPIRFSLTI